MINLKYLIISVITLFLIIGTVNSEECIYGSDGTCMEPCPPGTKSYSPGCPEEVMSQRTCLSPVARSLGEFCDYSRCDCPGDRVWDEAANKCVLLKDCSDQTAVKKDNDGRI